MSNSDSVTSQRKRINRKLGELGMSWAVQQGKYVGPNDPLESQIKGRKTYHIHPDKSEPRGDYMVRFDTLNELEEWLDNGGTWGEGE